MTANLLVLDGAGALVDDACCAGDAVLGGERAAGAPRPPGFNTRT